MLQHTCNCHLQLSVTLLATFFNVSKFFFLFFLYILRCLCSDHRSQHHRDGNEDDKPTVPDADYTELQDIGADNAAHLYSELDSFPTHNKLYANA